MLPKQLKDSQRHQRQPKQVKLFLQSPLPALPSEFNRDCSKGQVLLHSCQIYILLCPESFSNDQITIIWALLYMKSGRVAKWAACIFKWEEKNEGYTKFLDWDDWLYIVPITLQFYYNYSSNTSNTSNIKFYLYLSL